jgi:hypothetical protein
MIRTAQSFSRLSTNMAIFLWEANIKMFQVKRVGGNRGNGLQYSGSVQGPSTGSYKQHQPSDWLSTGTEHRILQTAPTFQLAQYRDWAQDLTNSTNLQIGSVQELSTGSYKQHQPSDWLSTGTEHRILQTAPTFRYNKKPLVSSLAEQISGSQAGLYSLRSVQDYVNEASTF